MPYFLTSHVSSDPTRCVPSAGSAVAERRVPHRFRRSADVPRPQRTALSTCASRAIAAGTPYASTSAVGRGCEESSGCTTSWRAPTTPRLEALARSGIRYTNEFTNGAMTMPSLPQLLTSQYFPDRADATLATLLFAAEFPLTRAIVNNENLALWLMEGLTRLTQV
jgi:hypothetical protein